VVPLDDGGRLPMGMSMLGRVLDGAGRALDGKGGMKAEDWVPMDGPVINPLNRDPISRPLDVGIRSINGLLTVGRGQRLGLFAGTGVGKSVLLGMMTRFTEAEIIVVGLIGERGREVKEFIEHILGEEGSSARWWWPRQRTMRPDASARGDVLHAHRRVLPRQGQERPAADGLADPFCPGPARNRPGHRRAAGHPWLSAFGVRQAAQAGGAGR
jgi:hypothetical protein